MLSTEPERAMAKRQRTKTEHSGAKNGGGYWGTREEAKQISNRLRREQDRRQIAEQVLSAEPRPIDGGALETVA